MDLRIRNHIPGLTAVLTILSLAAVFAAVLGIIPQSSLPRAPETLIELIPHVNAVISTVAVITILLGVRFIRRGDVRRHRAMMLTSVGLFIMFLVLYLYKVILKGPAEFLGPDVIYQYIYLPTLAVHILLAVICIPLLYYVALIALSRPIEAIYESRHKLVGRVAASLWLISFVLGNVVYVMLYVVY
jgi:putative membrane protein